MGRRAVDGAPFRFVASTRASNGFLEPTVTSTLDVQFE
jgi:hypothetical protein